MTAPDAFMVLQAAEPVAEGPFMPSAYPLPASTRHERSNRVDQVRRKRVVAERYATLRAAARAVLEPWIAAETAPGRRARDRALDDVSRAMVALAAELDRRGP